MEGDHHCEIFGGRHLPTLDGAAGTCAVASHRALLHGHRAMGRAIGSGRPRCGGPTSGS
jgi:hypothetical protein